MIEDIKKIQIPSGCPVAKIFRRVTVLAVSGKSLFWLCRKILEKPSKTAIFDRFQPFLSFNKVGADSNT